MAGNRFNRLPMSNDFFTSGGSVTNALEIIRLTNDINRLGSAVEQELKRMSHKIDEDDSISVSDQIAWFMNSS
jgi:hypothetical protein|tara:strand:+ start:1285 stop:1503 length:219 start_codon:yes stop_codon:yes gene_type:complete